MVDSFHRLRVRIAPWARRAAVAAGAAVLAACASAPHEQPERSKLNRYELQSIAPEIREHANCLARADGDGAFDVRTLRDERCAPTRVPLQARLQAFNLSATAQREYFATLEFTSHQRMMVRHGDVATDGTIE